MTPLICETYVPLTHIYSNMSLLVGQVLPTLRDKKYEEGDFI